LIGGAMGLGVFDTWMDMRKVRISQEQSPE
jgi:hypothetical protein